MSYSLYNDEDLTKDVLLEDADFISDAAQFLGEREGFYSDNAEELYDRFLEHFRYQNVNEVTATRDLFYAQDADDEGKARMGRLMDTFDRMDTELGLAAAQDYVGGVLFAPSTYAGMFSFGAAKAGTLAAQQGLKIGIRQILKRGIEGAAVRSGALRSAAGAAAVDVPFAAGTVLAQEQTRVETGQQEEIDMTNVGLSAALSTVGSGTIGAVTGAKRAITGNRAEEIRQIALGKERVKVEAAHKTSSVAVLKSNRKSNFASNSTVGKDAKKFKDTIKMALEETVPEKLAEGRSLKKSVGPLETKEIENIAAAAARIVNKIPPIGKVSKTGKIKEERLTSRLARGLADGDVSEKELAKILNEHNVTMQQLSSLFAERLSEAGAELGAVGRVSQAQKKQLLEELTEIDQRLMNLGSITEGARQRLKQNPIKGMGPKSSNLFRNWFSPATINKARIGLMTVQLATTARNTTNGYMRNYVYALDNVGTGISNILYGTGQKIAGISDKQLKDAGKKSVSMGVAQLRAGIQAGYMKDLWLGTTSVETQALDLLFRDPRFAKSNLAKEIFREMGDIGELTGEEGGLLFLARKANVLNTMSDNMFKRAIFSREIDKYLRASGQKGGLMGFFNDNYLDPKTAKKAVGMFSQIDDNAIGEAMEEALSFTYQTGKFQGKTGGFNKFADFVIDTASNSILASQAVPFPRYLINQFIFLYEHTPIVGLYNMGGILQKRGDVASSYAERFGKQFGGLATLGAFYGARVQFGDETTGPYQYYDPTNPNKTFKAEANLGPFMGFAMMADLLYRLTGPNRKDIPLLGRAIDDAKLPQLHDNDKVAVDIPYNVREVVQAFTGGQARAGVGLDIMDGMVDLAINYEPGGGSEQAFFENVVKLAGNFLNTYTVGAGMLKDIAGTTMGEEYRVVKDNTSVNFMEYFFKQAGRSIPQTVDVENGDRPLGRPTRSDPVKNVNPFLKMITGLTEEEEKTIVERELDRLRFDYVELSPRKIKTDAPLSNEARLRMGQYMENQVTSYFLSPDYQGLHGDRIKKAMLKAKINEFRTNAVNSILKGELDFVTEEGRIRRFKAAWNNMGGGKRGVIKDIYSEQTNGRNFDKDLSAENGDQLYRWAVSTERGMYGSDKTLN